MEPTDTQRAYESIKERIVTTKMPPGALIREAELMTELGLGRTPIREALKLLEAERLVVVSPRRGMFVTSINISDLAQIQEIRSVLDLLCVRLAATRITPSQMAELKELIRLAANIEPSGDITCLLALDQRFHMVLAEASRNELLRAEIETLYNLSMRIWYYYLGRMDPEDLAFGALAEIVNSFQDNDVQKAEEAMFRHIQQFGESVRKHL